MIRTLFFLMVTIILLADIVIAVESGDKKPVPLSHPIVATLSDVRSAEVKTESASEVDCFLSFPDSVPDFFYEIDPDTGRVIIKLLNAKIGEMIVQGKIDTVNIGPVARMITHQEILNKNEAMTALKPEWYSVVLIELYLKPMIRKQKDIIVSEIENAITISFPWPENQSERNRYYFISDKGNKKIVVASLIGVGTAGLAAGGYLVYHFFFNNGDSNELKPVLPEHPSLP